MESLKSHTVDDINDSCYVKYKVYVYDGESDYVGIDTLTEILEAESGTKLTSEIWFD
jgi:hypothetical protein